MPDNNALAVDVDLQQDEEGDAEDDDDSKRKKRMELLGLYWNCTGVFGC